MRRFKTHVIVNPESNRGRTRKRWGDIREAMKNFLREYKYEFTEKPCHATEITRQVIRKGPSSSSASAGTGP